MRTSILFVVVLIASGCAGPTRSPTAISQSAAIATALQEAGSSTPAKLVWAKLTTYGAAANGGSIVPASTPVWAVRLSGSFHAPSCGPYTATPHPCPSPAASALILIDARSGAFVQGEMPAP